MLYHSKISTFSSISQSTHQLCKKNNKAKLQHIQKHKMSPKPRNIFDILKSYDTQNLRATIKIKKNAR